MTPQLISLDAVAGVAHYRGARGERIARPVVVLATTTSGQGRTGARAWGQRP